MAEKTMTTAKIMDGKAVAASIREKLKAKVDQIIAKGGRKPGLSVVLVGDNPASAVYVKNKIKACSDVGIESTLKHFPADAGQNEVLDCIQQLNNSLAVDGILVQLPLPAQLDTQKILYEVAADKDVDGLHPHNLGLLMEGRPGLRPCTPSGIMVMLEHYGVQLAGSSAVVVGRSNLVGKPISLMLLEKNATVTMCHSKSKQLEDICKTADVLVVAAGREQMVKASWVKPGAVVVDVGINKRTDSEGASQLVGDVDFEDVQKVASLITPVPGGVGPMTIAMLLSNTLVAYERHQ
jgi:methylenetetrahydrofolate dehydrogenase (NADP+) / methenyltetrahydrofolate cyclohydrolase